MIRKLKKLKGRSFAEIADRGCQSARAFTERIGISGENRVPSDTAFFELFGTSNPPDAEDLLKRYRTSRIGFYPVFDDPSAAVAELRARFPGEEQRIVGEADELIAGKFDLLGYTELNFGSPVPDWHFEPVSGKRSPGRHWSQFNQTDPAETGDKKIVWELNRHQYFTVLGRAYWLTGDEKYADAFFGHLSDWMAMNPPKSGVNWASSLEIAYRSVSWTWALLFFRNSPRWTADVFLSTLKFLYLNGRHIERHLSTYNSPNTHLTGEAFGLYTIGCLLDGIAEAGKWKATGYAILIEEISRQIRRDGGYVEQATQYQRYTADLYLSLHILRKAGGEPVAEIHERQLRKMLMFLAHIAEPNGETPLIGDDDGGRLHFFDGRAFNDFRSTLALGSIVLNDRKLKFAAGEASPELLWLGGPKALSTYESIEPEPVSDLLTAFPDTGWYVCRDGWQSDSNFALIDCGEHGFMNGGHAHADALSVIISVKGIPTFVDSGTYTYTADQTERDHFRSSLAHNCLTVNGQSSSIPDGPFSWKTSANSKLIEWDVTDRNTRFRGSHDGFERFGVKYERELVFVPNREICITDFISTISRNDFAISFVLSPMVEAEILDRTRIVIRTKDGKLRLLTIVTKVVEESASEFDGWKTLPARISRRYGSRVETQKIAFDLNREGDFHVENSITFEPPA